MKCDKPRILVIDDQYGRLQVIRDRFLNLVDGDQYQFEFCSGQSEGINSLAVVVDAVRQRWPPRSGNYWSLVLLDVQFDSEALDGDARFGFDILAELRSEFGDALPIVMLTADDHNAKRRTANRAQADGYIEKEALTREAFRDVLEIRGYLEDSRDGKRLVGQSLPLLVALREVRAYAKQYASNSHLGSRIFYGETGTGKTEFATYAHWWSGRDPQRFIKWTAEGKDEEMVKNTLFGRWKGSHSEAKRSGPGAMESAHGGTLFIDEVANLLPRVQNLLLEYRRRDDDGLRTISRLGGFPTGADATEARRSVLGQLQPDHRIKIDVMALWATNIDLRDDRIRNEIPFRNDLYRAMRPEIILPSLNDRREDIPLLFDEFLSVSRNGKSTAVHPEVIDYLVNHDWTDKNIVALEQVAEYVSTKLGTDFDEVLLRHVESSGLLKKSISKPTQDKSDHSSTAPDSSLEGTLSISLLAAALTGIEVSSDPHILRGLLPKLQLAYADLILKVFGAALAASKDLKSGDTSSLDALCLLLDRPSLTTSGKGQSTKAKDIVKRLIALSDTDFSKRGAEQCQILSEDPVVLKHLQQALNR